MVFMRQYKAMWLSALRGIVAHASPVLVAQLSSIGMMVVDTVVLGHVSADDLAAVAIGGGIHVALVFALVGMVQAVAPIAAHHYGAGEEDRLDAVLQQGLWLALLLSVPGVFLLNHPEWLLSWSSMEGRVAAKVGDYFRILAWGLPAALCYRTLYAFCNALGRPRVLMGIGLLCLLLHAGMAWGLAGGAWLGAPLGVVGCALSNVLLSWLAMSIGLGWLGWSALGRRLQLFRRRHAPSWRLWRELLRLGLPMGFSNLVEITSFTLIALFIAPLGAATVAGNRIVANLAALAYMLPLSVAIATLSGVGQAVGGARQAQARQQVAAGMALAALASSAVGILLWSLAKPLVAAYTDDVLVREVALGLIAYIAVYQFFDALQTVAGHVLRAYRVTFVPMLVQVVCFWGVGLGGGAWLCYRWPTPLGVAGFWLAAVLSIVLAAALLVPLMLRVMGLVARERAP